MRNLIEHLARLSAPARIGVAVGAVSVAGATAAVLRPDSQDQVLKDQRVQAHAAAPTSAPPAGQTLEETGLVEGVPPLEIEVDPEVLKWPEEFKVEISGTTAVDAADPHVTLVVTSPTGRTYEIEPAPVAMDGSFQAEFDLLQSDPPGVGDLSDPPDPSDPPVSRFELGEYQVTARSPGGFASGTAKFTTVRFDQVDPKDWEPVADLLARRALTFAANLRTCINSMAISPARNELAAKVGKLEKLLAQGGTTKAPVGRMLALVVEELEELPDPALPMTPLLEPLKDSLDAWAERAKALESESRETDRCQSLDICDRADAIAQDLDKLQKMIEVLEEPARTIAGYRTSKSLAEAVRRYSMPDTAFLRSKLERAEAGLDGRSPKVAGLGSLTTWFKDVRSGITTTGLYARQELFEPYCQKFEGPIMARMEASFANKQGKVWWRYQIALRGTLTLRYPETAAGPRRLMSGELTGCASRFKSEEDALRVGWPTLLAGALLYRTAKEPYDGDQACAAFDIPVKAELSDDEIVLTIEPQARKDYGEPTVSIRYVVISPLAGGLPAQTSFTLPYKNAHFILTRALEDKPLKLPLRQEGRRMVVAADRSASSGRAGSRGNYSLNLKACNPACSQ